MTQPTAGYRELEHTADWELEVWAPNLGGLFEQAARGMYALSGVIISSGERTRHSIDLTAPDPESLLVTFLSELLYLVEQAGLGFDKFQIAVDDDRLEAELEGAPLAGMDKEIKAVTYHNLQIQTGPRGFEARLVFDV